MSIAKYVKIGLFFVTMGVGGTAYVIMAGDGFSAWNTKMYEVVLDDATGLSLNSKVFLAGVPVGKIQDIALSEGKAMLKVAFLKDVQIRGDASISRQSSSLLGTSMLALAPGTAETPLLEPGSRVGTEAAGGDFRGTLTTVNDLGAQISALIKEFQENHLKLLAVSLETINTLGATLNERSAAEMDRVSRILESSALITERFEALTREREGDINASVGDVRAALADIRAITEEVRSGKGNVGRAFYDDALYEKLLAVVDESETAAQNLTKILASVEDLSANADQTISSVDALAKNTNDTVTTVNTLAKNADRIVLDAGDWVAKASGLEVQVAGGASYGLLSGSGGGTTSLFIEPRSKDRWYRIGVSGAAGSGLFDAELARKLGPLTLRGGLLESSAGIGLDYRPLPVLELSTEAFDFRQDATPNVRAYLTLYPFFDPKGEYPWNWLYLRGGVSAAFDNGRRDFFLGGGLRFADEEVRGLVGLIPLVGN